MMTIPNHTLPNHTPTIPLFPLLLLTPSSPLLFLQDSYD